MGVCCQKKTTSEYDTKDANYIFENAILESNVTAYNLCEKLNDRPATPSDCSSTPAILQ